MAYTVTELIANAYYISGIVSREFQTVSGQQVNDGLILLNEVITDKYADTGMLPYYTKYQFNAVAGQESYFIPNLIEIETLTFFINTIRYSMRQNFRKNYFGSARANNITSLPFNWYFERQLGGGNIYLYFFPNENYPLEVWGLFGLSQVSLNQDLTLTLDQFYISYLKYALSQKLCINYNYDFPPGANIELQRYQLKIDNSIGGRDLHMTKISTIGKISSLNYGQANLGHGWTTS